MNKREKCWGAGLISTASVISGGALLIAGTGGAVLLVGGVILGAGISGTTNCIEQNYNKETEFSDSSFMTNFVIGAATSVVTSGTGAIASGVVSKFGLEGAKKIGTNVLATAAGGAISSVTGTTLEGKKINIKEIGKSALIGGFAGGLG
jgi:hypothetical protein